jgi:hypothetical protein
MDPARLYANHEGTRLLKLLIPNKSGVSLLGEPSG